MEGRSIQSNPSSRQICKYDVFLSFRGEDTRNTFTDHLDAHLTRKGIFTFKDDKRLREGEAISPQLEQAIKDSRVSIVVFSKDYAGSTWCLEEMAIIADCKKTLGQTVLPVFYDVNPSHVRKQKGVYKKAFARYEKKFERIPGKVDRWKSAMTELGSSVGWDVRNKPEFGAIEKIIEVVIKKLGHKFSSSAADLVGLIRRITELESLLKLSSEDDHDLRGLGIWGMSGIGKTTLAAVLYDRISYQFGACCFIENVSQIFGDGQATAVHKQILRQTLDEKNLETYGPSEIAGIVKNRLPRLKVLIVLDNVDESDQLEELAIYPMLLRKGSRIIITTRNKRILQGYEIYEVPILNKDEARELLLLKAFKSSDDDDDDRESKYENMISTTLKYAQGLPLAIEKLGSLLCNREHLVWRDALRRLRKYPDNRITNGLQQSIKGLHSTEKEIFLDIACFFNGKREDYVRPILDCCELGPKVGIEVLSEKSLITIRNQEIQMHKMLQELGKKIVQDNFPRNPGLWSRLWHYKDLHHVQTTETGTNSVEAIVLDKKKDGGGWSQLSAEEFSRMRGLRLLILYHQNFSGDLNFLSNRLHYLFWHGYSFPSLPSSFQPDRLVELNMPGSSIEYLWEGRKDLPNLRRVNVSNSTYLIKTPDFAGVPKLEQLDLTGCTSLSRVHPSIGLLEKLAFLSLRNCCSLVSLLDNGTECNLRSLKVVYLSGCSSLKIPPDFGRLVCFESRKDLF